MDANRLRLINWSEPFAKVVLPQVWAKTADENFKWVKFSSHAWEQLEPHSARPAHIHEYIKMYLNPPQRLSHTRHDTYRHNTTHTQPWRPTHNTTTRTKGHSNTQPQKARTQTNARTDEQAQPQTNATQHSTRNLETTLWNLQHKHSANYKSVVS